MAFDEEPDYTAALGRLHAEMTQAAFADAWTAGSAMSQTDAVALALAA
jgi:hypothetical protein